MLRAAREQWRRARSWPVLRPLVRAADRAWWAQVIRRADIVDVEFASAQLGRPVTAGRAIRAYVRGGHARGMSLNPLACERTIARQLPEQHRVPALYAYLVNSRDRMDLSPNWDAVRYDADHPGTGDEPGGPLGHAWRSARASGTIDLGFAPGTVRAPWHVVHARAVAAAREARAALFGTTLPRTDRTDARTAVHLSVVIAAGEPFSDETLVTAAEVTHTLDCPADIAVCPDAEGHVHPDTWVQASLLGVWNPAVSATLQQVDDPVGWAMSRAAEHGGADVVLIRGAGERISAESLAALARAGATGPIAPLRLAADGVVSSAGVVSYGGRAGHLLAGHPPEDAASLGETITVAGLGTTTRAVPGIESAEKPRTLLTSVVFASAAPPACESTDDETDIDGLLRESSLHLARWADDGPVLLRRARTVRLPDGTDVPSLRWAVKTAAPAGAEGQAWGDTHFAKGIAEALRRLGQEVVVDAFSARNRPTTTMDDVSLVLRGPRRIDPPATGRSVLWVISHPDEITADELSRFDRVFAASTDWAARAAVRLHHPITPLLQCTDAGLFRPSGVPRTDEIVFVGTARGIARPSVVAPIAAGIPVLVYGPDWRPYIPGRFIRAARIRHSELPARYESAAVVLNDHWPAMRSEGFISNRPYDVVAAGGRVISDAVNGLAEHFGGAVRTYETTAELIGMLNSDLDELFPDARSLSEISRRVRTEDSFDARARTLLDAALDRSAD